VVILVLVLAGCERTPAPSPHSTRSPTPLDTAATGTIRGHVRFSGSVPPPRPVDITTDPTCAALHPGGLAIADVRTADGALVDAFVYIKSGLGTRVFPVPPEPVVIDQRGCEYVPRVTGARVGQRIEFVNSDDTLHNVHGAPTSSPAWNFGLGVVGARRALVLDSPEVAVPIRCDVHPWMRAYIGVVDHPYFAVTGDDGAFTLDRVPAGRYVVGAWHAQLGTRDRPVDVPPGAAASVEVRFDD
jgi:plastocyanin